MNQLRSVLGVIPTRFDSKRLPGKALRNIAGKPMLLRVYEAARRCALLDELVVATDSERIADFCGRYHLRVIVTGEHPSGSDRLFEVMGRTSADLYVNIQGDEPMIRAEHIDRLLEPLLENLAEVTTLKVRMTPEAATDPNNVKVVTDLSGRALYFSRSPIPYDRDQAGATCYYKHIGLYAYTRAALETFHQLPQSSLELTEKLEQLRFLQNGISIHVAETPFDTIGVDTEQDLAAVNEWFQAEAGG